MAKKFYCPIDSISAHKLSNRCSQIWSLSFNIFRFSPATWFIELHGVYTKYFNVFVHGANTPCERNSKTISPIREIHQGRVKFNSKKVLSLSCAEVDFTQQTLLSYSTFTFKCRRLGILIIGEALKKLIRDSSRFVCTNFWDTYSETP